MSLADEIMAEDDLPSEPVIVPEWKGRTLYVHTLSGPEFVALRSWWREGVPEKAEVPEDDYLAKTVIATTRDADGKPVFTRDHLAALKAKSGVALIRLFAVAGRLNGLTAREEEAIKANFPVTPGSNGSTGSPTAGGGASSDCSASSTPAS